MQVNPQSFSIEQLCKDARRKTINPSPAYQRTSEGVWNLAKKQLLMDSVLRGYDIPKFYFRSIEKGSKKSYEVIDGQQRLRTIWDFFDDKFALGEISKDLPQGDLSGKVYSRLSADDQDTWGSFQLTVAYVVEASEAEVRDLFLRLQEGVALNPAEKRNAVNGPLRDFVAELAGNGRGKEHPVLPRTHLDRKRFGWDDIIAHCLRLEISGGPADVKAADLMAMYKSNPGFKKDDPPGKNLTANLNFMAKVLKSSPPEMRVKWGFIDLYLAIRNFREAYVSLGRETDIETFFVNFEKERISVDDPADLLSVGRDDWDRDLYDYIEAFQKEGGKRQSIEVRHNVYLRRMLRDTDPQLKDPKRLFTKNERIAIWRNADGKCEQCEKKLAFEEMQGDHIVPHAKGGSTSLLNGQCLCGKCNPAKGVKAV